MATSSTRPTVPAVQGGAPPNYKWVKIPLITDISPIAYKP